MVEIPQSTGKAYDRGKICLRSEHMDSFCENMPMMRLNFNSTCTYNHTMYKPAQVKKGTDLHVFQLE
jgi:hypothetical protein